jgi:signal peptidase II
MGKNFYKYFFFATTILIIDRITKLAALAYAQVPCIINDYLAFELTFNRGISWGIFHDATGIVFVIVSTIIAVITVFLCGHAYHAYRHKKLIVGHMCIIAGSAANLIDRVIYGGVVDFIVLSYGPYSWPVFNIADMAIVVGVGLLVVLDEM